MTEAPVSLRLERLLEQACEDAVFAEDLVARRSRAAADRGLELGDSERAMLDAISETQLRGLLKGLVGGPRRGPGHTSDSDAANAPRELYSSAGVRPDLPEGQFSDGRPAGAPIVRGMKADLPPFANGPHSVVRGHSSRLPIVAAAGAVVLVGGAIAGSCCTHGMRSDIPPVPAPPIPTDEPGSEK